MLLLHYNKYDESTDEYETGDIAHIEYDGDADDGTLYATIYTENGSWYITLNDQDLQKLHDFFKIKE